MNRNNLIKEMRDCIGKKDPIEFFSLMTEVFDILFNDLDQLKEDNTRLKICTALSIQWEPKVASELLAKQIDVLRKDKDTYFSEIHDLKTAYAEGKVVKSYDEFCKFWITTLGWHPFLEYKD